jgi:hypothetical protein
MSKRRTSRAELLRYFQHWLDTGFQNGLITRHRRAATMKAMRGHLQSLVTKLNDSGRVRLKLGGHTALLLFLREGQDPKDGKFNLYEIRWSGRKRPKKLVCFLGHRFLKSISSSLRMNLRYILEPSNIGLVWSGQDLNASAFFDDIVKKIKKSDFCIFDNRGASEKPNVYIEAGIAYVLRKPFILANYAGNHLGVPSTVTA